MTLVRLNFNTLGFVFGYMPKKKKKSSDNVFSGTISNFHMNESPIKCVFLIYCSVKLIKARA